MGKSINLQDQFLTTLQAVTTITTNGFQLKGVITDFDQYTILVESKAGRHLVYKSAVSTIVKEG